MKFTHETFETIRAQVRTIPNPKDRLQYLRDVQKEIKLWLAVPPDWIPWVDENGLPFTDEQGNSAEPDWNDKEQCKQFKYDDDGNLLIHGENKGGYYSGYGTLLGRLSKIVRIEIEYAEKQIKTTGPGDTKAPGQPPLDARTAAPVHKIRWMGTQNQLVLLFRELDQATLLHQDTMAIPWATIEDCFVGKDGQPLPAEQMKVVAKDQQAKGAKAEVIKKIVKRVSEESS
jgi:hypothetical protein